MYKTHKIKTLTCPISHVSMEAWFLHCTYNSAWKQSALNVYLPNGWMNTQKKMWTTDTLLLPCRVQPKLCIMVSIYPTMQMYQFLESSRYAYREKLCRNKYQSLLVINFFTLLAPNHVFKNLLAVDNDNVWYKSNWLIFTH